MSRMRRGLAALLTALLGLTLVGLGTTSAYAADRQPLDTPLRVEEGYRNNPLGSALGSVSVAAGVPGAWAYTASDPGTSPDPGQSGYGVIVNVWRVLPYAGTDLSEERRQEVCQGTAIGADSQPFVRPSIDLSTIPWFARGLREGYLILSEDYTGDSGWNPNLDGLIWTPATHGERIDFVDLRLLDADRPGREWNAQLIFHDHVAYTPAWECSPVPPFEPETEEKDPAAVPDRGTVPVGTRVITVSILDNDELPNGVTSVEIIDPPVNGTASVDGVAESSVIVYAPNQGFHGEDRLVYRVTDVLGKTSETDVVIQVEASEPVMPEPEPSSEPEPELDPTSEPEDSPQPEEVPGPEVEKDRPDPERPQPFRAATGVEPDTVRGTVLLAGGVLLLLASGVSLVRAVRSR